MHRYGHRERPAKQQQKEEKKRHKDEAKRRKRHEKRKRKHKLGHNPERTPKPEDKTAPHPTGPSHIGLTAQPCLQPDPHSVALCAVTRSIDLLRVFYSC
jgi:hypothetical protein